MSAMRATGMKSSTGFWPCGKRRVRRSVRALAPIDVDRAVTERRIRRPAGRSGRAWRRGRPASRTAARHDRRAAATSATLSIVRLAPSRAPARRSARPECPRSPPPTPASSARRRSRRSGSAERLEADAVRPRKAGRAGLRRSARMARAEHERGVGIGPGRDPFGAAARRRGCRRPGHVDEAGARCRGCCSEAARRRAGHAARR